ncbi:MAG: hypothetical protein IPK07_13050 [Deltaproteobacteria bacterium]|nr:hypothetical protein [Deltaproteobacteria bacterium]
MARIASPAPSVKGSAETCSPAAGCNAQPSATAHAAAKTRKSSLRSVARARHRDGAGSVIVITIASAV